MKDLEQCQVEIVLAKGQVSPAQLRTLEQGTVVPFLDRCPVCARTNQDNDEISSTALRW